MRNYAGTCKGICSYNLVYNFLIQLLPLQSSVFVVHFSNAFWYGNEAFPKGSSCCSPCSLSFVTQLIQGYENIFSLVSLSKSKFLTRVVRVARVSHLCRTYVAFVLLVSHSCCSRVIRIALVLHSCRSCLALVL